MPSLRRPLLAEVPPKQACGSTGEAGESEAAAAGSTGSDAPRPVVLRSWASLLALLAVTAGLLYLNASLPATSAPQVSALSALEQGEVGLGEAELRARRASLLAELERIDRQLELWAHEKAEQPPASEQTPWAAPEELLADDYEPVGYWDGGPGGVLDAIADNPTVSAAVVIVVLVSSFTFVTIAFAQDPRVMRRDEELQLIRAPSSSKLNRPDFWTSHAEVRRFLYENLAQESYADLSCFGLCLNRPWRSRKGPPIKPDRVTSNSVWMASAKKQRSFPNGHDNLDFESSANMWRLVLNFWKFLFKKKQPYKCLFLQFLEGLCIPAQALVMGWTVGQVNSEGNIHKLCLYCAVMLCINLIYERAEYIYQIDVPGASVRYEFTYRLHKQFLSFEGDVADQWPPGRCSAMLSYDVIQAVNLNWEAIFGLVKTTTSLVMCTAIMIFTTRALVGVANACIIIFAALFLGTLLVTYFRIPNCLDLANKKRDWQLAWMAICTLQVRRRREGITFNLDEAVQEVSDAAMVFRKRAFHYYFIRLVATLTPAEMAFLAEALVAVLAGLSAINGKLTTSEAAALIGVVKLLSGQLKAWVTLMLNIVEGFSSLVEICEVFNEPIEENGDATPHFWRAQSMPVRPVGEMFEETNPDSPLLDPRSKLRSTISTQSAV